jgi:hypothetical protein
MLKLSTAIAVAAVLAAGAPPAAAAQKGQNAAMAQREASCKAQAAKKFSAIRFLARKDFVDKCMGRNAMAKKTPKSTKRAAQR